MKLVFLVSEHPLYLAKLNKMYDVLGLREACPSASTWFAWRWGHFGSGGNEEFVSIGVCPIGCNCSGGKCDKPCGQILDLKYDIDLGIISFKAVLSEDSPGVRVIFNEYVVNCCGGDGWTIAYYRDIPGNVRAGVPFYVHIITHPIFVKHYAGRWGSHLLLYQW